MAQRLRRTGNANAGLGGCNRIMGELAQRISSGVLLAVVLIGDLWLGSWWYAALLALGAVVIGREYTRLVWRGWSTPIARALWLIFGAVYIGLALYGLWYAREQGFFAALLLFVAVWATDIGAFVFGRAIGGPKIAPRISPSKTWAGLVGGIITTTVAVFSAVSLEAKIVSQVDSYPWDWGLNIGLWGMLACALITIIAQAGDFFESWMKRRAGLKDSGGIIPGHGGLLDRIDGLLPVAALFPFAARVAFPT